MEYISRTVRSRPGLSQEEALDSLQSSPNFKPGVKIASFRRRGDRWVAELKIPKTAGPFPPKEDSGESESPSDSESSDSEDSEDSDSGPPIPEEGPPSPEGESGPPGAEKGKGGTEEQMLHVLTEILHALKGGPPMGGLGGPDDLGPGGPPPPGPPAGPAAGKGPMGGAGSKLRPGEVPNKPGVTPIGAPAFASTHQAMLPGPGAAGPVGPGATGPGGGTCPTCGGPMGPDGRCATCQGGAPATPPAGGALPGGGMSPLASRIAALAGRKATIPVSSPASMSIKEAKSELEQAAAPFGYKVAQVKYCGSNCTCGNAGSTKIHALLTVR